jgi:hypothetical protein
MPAAGLDRGNDGAMVAQQDGKNLPVTVVTLTFLRRAAKQMLQTNEL